MLTVINTQIYYGFGRIRNRNFSGLKAVFAMQIICIT